MHEASQGSFSRVFDLEVKDLEEEDAENRTSPFESRFPINIGITGHVAATGEVGFVASACWGSFRRVTVDSASPI